MLKFRKKDLEDLKKMALEYREAYLKLGELEDVITEDDRVITKGIADSAITLFNYISAVIPMNIELRDDIRPLKKLAVVICSIDEAREKIRRSFKQLEASLPL